MKLKSYNYFLFESILYTSKDFLDILIPVYNSGDPVAKYLVQMVEADIKTNYNILNVTDKNDLISFVSDNQATTKLKQMTLAELFNVKGNSTGIGRIAKSILKDNGHIVSDKEIENFVNKFKATWDAKNIKKEYIKLVKGDDIKYWYFEERYCGKGRATLSKSCMRYDYAQDFFEIYTQNPEVCQLLIKVDDNDKLESRALLWKTNRGPYLDRIYYTYDSDVELLTNWYKEKFGPNVESYDYSGHHEWSVQLNEKIIYGQYPYMDTFTFFSADLCKLYSYEPSNVNRKRLYLLQDTEGEYSRQDLVYCEYEGESYPEEETVWSTQLASHIHKENAIWSDYLNSYIHNNSAVKSKMLNDYLDSGSAIQIYLDVDESKMDWYPQGSDDYAEDEPSGKYYLKTLLTFDEEKDVYYLKEKSIIGWEVSKESWEDYKNIYHMNDEYICSEIDAQLFGFKLDEDYSIYTKRNFYRRVYQKVVYKDFVKLIESKDAPDEIKQAKLRELEEANTLLLTDSDFYKRNNYMIDRFGGIKEMMEWYKSALTKDVISDVTDYSNRLFNGWDNMNVLHDLAIDYIKNSPDIIYKSERSRDVLSEIKNDVSDKIPDTDDIKFNTQKFIQYCTYVIQNCISVLQRHEHGVGEEARTVYYYLNNIHKFEQ